MNASLQKALAELIGAGATGLPSKEQVENAKDGTSWEGKKRDGSQWQLTKNNADSFNCMC